MKPTTCFAPAHILLPSEQVPLEQWGCIACDQFTSDRSYWQRAEKTAAGAPSTLNLIHHSQAAICGVHHTYDVEIVWHREKFSIVC